MYVRGYFKPPRDGQYTFYLAADDTAKLYFNPNTKSLNRTEMTMIAT